MTHDVFVLGRSTTASLGYANKQAINRATEDAFTRLVFAVVQPGERLASVSVIGDQDLDIEPTIEAPPVNVLTEKCVQNNDTK